MKSTLLVTLGVLINVSLALLFTLSSVPARAQVLASTATPSPIGFVASPTPTPLAPDPIVAEMLGARAGSGAALQILEYVHDHPNTPYRARLLAHVLEIANVEFPLDWLTEQWLDENIIAALNQHGRVEDAVLAQVREFWEGDFVASDWDADGTVDYFAALRWSFAESAYSETTGIYWIHRTGGTYERMRLPNELSEFNVRADVKFVAARDMNGDGRAEVVYEVFVCGRICGYRLHVLEYQKGGWRDLFASEDWYSGEEWTLVDLPDGGVEIVGAELGYPSAGYGTFFPYRAHFLLVNGMFLPVALSPRTPRERWEPHDGAEQLAHKLMYARRFQDALYVLEAVRDQYVPSPLGDMTPFFLFRIGLLKLLRDDVQGALETWDELAQKFPNHPAAESVKFRHGFASVAPTIQTREDVWKLCNSLERFDKTWNAGDSRWREGNNRSDTRVTQWYADCDPTMLLSIWDFSQRQDLEIQLARFGLQFETLSAQFDLNGDNITDPIGILYFADTRAPWVFLSDGDVYHPFFAAQPYPFGAIDLTFGEAFDDALFYQKIQLTDLDANDRPEILMMRTQGFQLWEWDGRRFRKHKDYFGEMVNAAFREGVIAIEPLPDGKQILRATLPATPMDATETIQYTLSNGVLTRMPPRIGDETPKLSAALNALFVKRDAREALQLLNTLERSSEFVSYLRALANKYTGEQ